MRTTSSPRCPRRSRPSTSGYAPTRRERRGPSSLRTGRKTLPPLQAVGAASTHDAPSHRTTRPRRSPGGTLDGDRVARARWSADGSGTDRRVAGVRGARCNTDLHRPVGLRSHPDLRHLLGVGHLSRVGLAAEFRGDAPDRGPDGTPRALPGGRLAGRVGRGTHLPRRDQVAGQAAAARCRGLGAFRTPTYVPTSRSWTGCSRRSWPGWKTTARLGRNSPDQPRGVHADQGTSSAITPGGSHAGSTAGSGSGRNRPGRG